MFNRQANIQLLTETMKLQEPLLVPYHDSSEHKYQPNEDGICEVCGWYHTENTVRLLCCGRTAREHAEELQERMKYFIEYIHISSDVRLANDLHFLRILSYIRKIRNALVERKNSKNSYSTDFPHSSN